MRTMTLSMKAAAIPKKVSLWKAEAWTTWPSKQPKDKVKSSPWINKSKIWERRTVTVKRSEKFLSTK